MGLGQINAQTNVSAVGIQYTDNPVTSAGKQQQKAADAIGIAPERPPERPDPTSVLDEIGDSTQPGGIKDEAQVNAEAPRLQTEGPLQTGGSSEDQISSETSDLPDGWNSAIDNNTGGTYYFNIETKETSWEHPGNSLETNEDKKSSKTNDLPEGWKQYHDEVTGNVFYYNSSKDESSWVHPKDKQWVKLKGAEMDEKAEKDAELEVSKEKIKKDEKTKARKDVDNKREEWNKKYGEFKQTQVEITTLETNMEAKEAELENLKKQVKDNQVSFDKKQEELNEEKENLFIIKDNTKKLEQQRSKVNERKGLDEDERAGKVELLDKQLGELSEKEQATTTSINALESEIEGIPLDNEVIQTEIVKAEQSILEMENQINSLQNKLNEQEQAHKSEMKSLHQMEQDFIDK